MACRRLGDLVEKAAAQQGLALDPSRRPFNNGRAQDPPLLRPNRAPNHILLYPGSFNPPHKGHLHLLGHVLRSAGTDLSLIAAIIVLIDDDKLAAKNNKDERPFLLARAKRVSLWREADISKDRCWVYEGSEDSWAKLRAQLQSNLARDRIDLGFLLLVGPDWIGARAVSDPKSWGCVEAVTSDVSRPVDFRCPNSLRQLAGCSMWEQRAPQRDPIGAAVWTCQTLRKPLRHYRFVPSDRPSMSQEDAPKSTDIRRAIATCQGERLEEELKKTALGPSLLMQYVLEGGPYTAPVARRQSLDHEARKEKVTAHVKW